MILNRLKRMDKWILIPYLVMVGFSIIMVYSASSYTAAQEYGNPEHYLLRQTMFVVAGIIAAFVTSMLSMKVIRSKKVIMILVTITILLFLYVLIFGDEINGAKRWIATPFFNIQPGEIAKLVVVWYLAYILSKKQSVINENFFKTVVSPCLLVGFMIFLVFLQPDTGTSVILFTITVIMIFASGISWKLGVSFSVLGVAGVFGLLEFIKRFGQNLPFIQGYRYERFLAFWNPFALADSHGLQLVNSYYALSQGGLFGVGLGNSIQKTGYLPFPYTDFIMAIVGEELGLIGILIILGIFTLIVARTFLIGVRSKNSFNSILCIGLGSLLLIQGCFNVGGVVGLIPITGLTFPFLSYGGSSMLILSIAIGLILNVSAREKIK